MRVSVPDPMFLLGEFLSRGLCLGVSVQRGSLSRDISVQRRSLSRGVLCAEGEDVSVQGVFVYGVSVQVGSLSRNQESGLFASY